MASLAVLHAEQQWPLSFFFQAEPALCPLPRARSGLRPLHTIKRAVVKPLAALAVQVQGKNQRKGRRKRRRSRGAKGTLNRLDLSDNAPFFSVPRLTVLRRALGAYAGRSLSTARELLYAPWPWPRQRPQRRWRATPDEDAKDGLACMHHKFLSPSSSFLCLSSPLLPHSLSLSRC